MLLETAEAKLRCEIVTDFEQFEGLCGDWERLWKADRAGEIFQSFAWARAWWHAYGQEFSLHCVIVYDDQAVIGILPLVRRHDELRFLGAPEADYTDIVCEEKRTLQVLTTAFSALLDSGHWRECKLEHLPSNSRIVRHYKKLPRRLQCYSRLVLGARCWTIMVRANAPDILNKLARKKDIRQHTNKLARLGTVSFRFIENKIEAQKYLSDFFRQHIRRRTLMGKSSRCQLPSFRRLLEGLLDELDPKEQLRFSALELNGNPVAYQFAFDTTDKYTMYQQTFDVNAWDYSPGNVLLRHTLFYADAKCKKEFDFSVGDEPYKARYANSVKDNLTLYLEPSTIHGRLRGFWRSLQDKIYRGAVKAKPFLHRNPRIYNVLAGVRAWMTGSASPQNSAGRDLGTGNWWLSLFVHVARFIWQAQDEILFRFQESHSTEHFAVADNNIEIVMAHLSHIADLLLETDNFPGNLDTWRERMSRGDQLLIVRKGGRTALTLWIAKDPWVLGPSLRRCPVDFDSSSMVYEHWFSQTGDISKSYRAALVTLIREAAEHKRSLWVCCPLRDKSQKRELSSVGFDPRYRVRNWQVFHWFHFDKVTPIKPSAGKLAQRLSEGTVGCITKTD